MTLARRSITLARRSTVRAALTALGAGALLIGSAGLAQADDRPPGCTSADLTGVMSGVSAGLASYLFVHPDVNDFFTSLQGQPKQAVRDQTEVYLNANPNVRDALAAIRQPSRDFRARCNLPQRGLILADNP
jgi:hemophore-related protein